MRMLGLNPMTVTHPQALRSTYPNGRYRPITKEQSAEFVRRVYRRLAPLGVEPEVVNEGSHAHSVWLFQSDEFGPFQVTLYHDQSTCFTIFTRFVGADLSAVQAKWGRFSPGANEPTGYTGKWNIHSNVAGAALEDLCYQINVVGAHKPLAAAREAVALTS